MERIATLLCAAVLVLLALAFVYGLLFNPIADRRASLEAELSQIKPVSVSFERPGWDFKQWEDSIKSKPVLWKELIPPPPPPPPPAPKPPDLEKLFKDVSMGRARIGSKAQLITKENPKGIFVSVGDEMLGCTVKEITKTSITFSMEWQGKELTKVIKRE